MHHLKFTAAELDVLHDLLIQGIHRELLQECTWKEECDPCAVIDKITNAWIAMRDGGDIVQTCVKCGRVRSEKVMQEAVFRDFVGDEPAGVWKCSSGESCRKERKRRNGNVSQDSNAVQA